MKLQKKGFPKEGELLLCTVTKIFGHSVFVNIEEYSKQGMVHISEISPGRIRNLRDYVVEGKKIVCVVLRINQEKGHIDLSLRRVNDNQKRRKLESIKIEQKSEKIVEQIAKELKKDAKQFYESTIQKVCLNYSGLNDCFNDVVQNKVSLEELGIEKESAEKLTNMIKERMKPPKIVIYGNLSLKSYEGDGIEIVKQALAKAENSGKESVVIRYGGGGDYNIIITADDYKGAEKILKNVTESAINFMEKNKGVASFKRIEK
ncbi:hypothetical protein CEE44_00325 [Candidatus Woesearchaeota archaeon B3_Woes]|nr:MAG: hypothetical protein CEE44_00325 [Candidatus Woesearchaeota archaeon B3_Woes]